MKNGLYHEDGHLVYYKDDRPKHAGVVKIDGEIYYISSKGRAVKGLHVVHHEMANGILKRGTYTFGEDYKLVKGSYIAPKKRKKHAVKKTARNRPRPNVLKHLNASIRRSWKKLSKKNQNTLLIVSALVAVLLIYTSISLVGQHISNQVHNTVTEPSVLVDLPTFDEDVLLCSAAANMEYNGELELKQAITAGNPYRPFRFEYTLVNTSGTLYLSEHEDLLDARAFMLEESNHYVDIDNLKTDTTYYYEVTAAGHSYTGSFHTAPGNRYVYIPGLDNTRDIGGYTTLDGKKIKQGLLIRGPELDGMVNAPYFIPEEELEAVQDTFGFAYDLDLRAPTIYVGTYSSRLEIPHAFYDAPMYGNIFASNYHPSLRNIFRDLADPQKYPMYLHCTWGRDRTGTVVFLLQGILNMSEEDMVREYRLTSYVTNTLAESTNMDVIINGLESYEGDTLQEKIVSFLTTTIGVTDAEIESIREIYLED